MRLAILLLTLLAAPAAFSQDAGSARQVLGDCIDSLEPGVVGLEDLDAACPGLEVALDALGVTAFVPEGQRNLLTVNGLANLRDLLDRYEQPPERASADVGTLLPVLEQLREPPKAERELSWYERFRRWLREALDRKESQSNPWLSRWLEDHSLSEKVQLALFYGVMLLVLLLAVLIIFNEVRTARANRRKASAAAGELAMLASGPSNLDVSAAGERPSMLLRMLIATLVKTGRLQGAPSLTHRELAARARFDDSSQRESFRRVALLAESETYGGKQLSSDALVEVVRTSQSLDAQLSGLAPLPGATA